MRLGMNRCTKSVVTAVEIEYMLLSRLDSHKYTCDDESRQAYRHLSPNEYCENLIGCFQSR